MPVWNPPQDKEKLNVKDVESGDLLVITGKGEIVNFKKEVEVEGRKTEVDDPKLKIYFILPNGERKSKIISSKSFKNLSKSWGDNSDAWDGKTAMVAVENTPKFGDFVVFYPTKQPISRGDGVTEQEVPF